VVTDGILFTPDFMKSLKWVKHWKVGHTASMMISQT